MPAEQRVGEENRGWYVAMTLLDNERSNISGAIAMEREIGRLIAYLATDVGRRRSRVSQFDSLRQQIAERSIEAAVMFNLSLRIITMQRAGQIPNYEASVSHLFGGDGRQRLARTGTSVFGLYANLWDPDDERAPMEASYAHSYARSAARVGGGTPEIQRNVIATRGLGFREGEQDLAKLDCSRPRRIEMALYGVDLSNMESGVFELRGNIAVVTMNRPSGARRVN